MQFISCTVHSWNIVLTHAQRYSFILQAIAAGWHYKSPAQLKELAALVGHSRILVMHGTRDRMVTFPHGEELLAGLGGEEAGVTKVFLEGQGHVIPIERRKHFKECIEQMVEKTSKMGVKGGDSEESDEDEEVNDVVVNGTANGAKN
jgi:pimeloyl-ACP methyl ester carboxylesterase